MTNYKEILRLKSLRLSNMEVASSCGCGRNTVTRVLQRAADAGLTWTSARGMTEAEITEKLFPRSSHSVVYRMPDYEHVHRGMQKRGVTLSLLWVEYCEQCRAAGDIPYQATQFNKYYADFAQKTKATMHLDHKIGATMQVDWAGQTAGIIDTDTGKTVLAYLFIAVLPYSGNTYAEACQNMKQEAWINAHVHAYQYFGGVTRLLAPENLKTGVLKNTKDKTVMNKSYQEMAEHYGTAILPARPRTPKDKAAVEGTVGIVSTWILAALRSQKFFSLKELNEAVRDKLYAFNHKPFQKKEAAVQKRLRKKSLSFCPCPLFPLKWRLGKLQPSSTTTISP